VQTYGFTTSVGRAVFLSPPGPPPRAFAIHGFKRGIKPLLPWADAIPGLAFLMLPGQNGAPAFSEVSVEVWAQGFAELMTALPAPPLIFAESLGAVVAMSVPSRAVVAVEPLLSVDHMWPLRRTIERARARGDVIEPELEAVFETPFTWVLDRISAPTLVLAGDEPLLPERQTPREPSLLTDGDFAAYAGHPLVEAHRIGGGHSLLDHNPAGVLAAARPFMLEHGFLPAAGDV
jgi:hypothetical protein